MPSIISLPGGNVERSNRRRFPIWRSFSLLLAKGKRAHKMHRCSFFIGENGAVTVDGTKYTGDASLQKDVDVIVSYTITPDGGYEINSVLYNGENVTSLVSGGVYTAPALTGNATLRVLFASTAHVHEWEDDYTVDKEATCTTDGSKSIHRDNQKQKKTHRQK